MLTDPPITDKHGRTAFTHWDRETPCPKCGARSVILVSTIDSAQFECRGTPAEDAMSVYGPDYCGHVFRHWRSKQEVAEILAVPWRDR